MESLHVPLVFLRGRWGLEGQELQLPVLLHCLELGDGVLIALDDLGGDGVLQVLSLIHI